MRLFILTLTICFLSFSLPVLAQSKRLTLKSALQHSYNNNPTLLAARANYAAATENISQALAARRLDISASANVDISRTDTSGQGFVTGEIDNVSKDYGINAEQPLFRGFRNFTEVASAKFLTKAQKLLLVDIENKILLDAATAYVDLLLSRYVAQANEGNLELLNTQLEAVNARFSVGEITRTDIAQAQARLAGAQADWVRAKGDVKAKEAAFTQIIGLSFETLAEPENISLEVLSSLPNSLGDSLRIAVLDSPKLQALAFQQKAAEKDIDSIFGELWPQLSLAGRYNKSFDPGIGTLEEFEEGVIGLRASISIYKGGGTRSRIRQSKYIASQRMIELREEERNIKQRVTESWANWLAAKAEISARMAQLEAAKTAQEGTYQEALVGERTVLDSLNADQDLLSASTDLARARRNEVVAIYSLAQELGLLQPSFLQFNNRELNYENIMKEAGKKLFSTKVN